MTLDDPTRPWYHRRRVTAWLFAAVMGAAALSVSFGPAQADQRAIIGSEACLQKCTICSGGCGGKIPCC
mgnify:CR=1 FL=1